MYFHRSILSLSKAMAEKLLMTFRNLKWPRGPEEGSLVAIFRFRVSDIPINRWLWVLGMDFVQKRRHSIFSHLLIIERSQNWSDLRSPISKFWEVHFINNLTRIKPWKFQDYRSVGVAMTSIQTFSEVGHLTWPGDLTLIDLGLKFSEHVQKICTNRCAKNGGVECRRFF